jgi:hypothetical protein
MDGAAAEPPNPSGCRHDQNNDQETCCPQQPALVADVAELFRNLAKALFDFYRPELHYMRGPGPKWHAKHDLPRAAKTVAAPMLMSARAGDALAGAVLIRAGEGGLRA